MGKVFVVGVLFSVFVGLVYLIVLRMSVYRDDCLGDFFWFFI